MPIQPPPAPHPSLFMPLNRPPRVHRPPKIGRNDPCWCGSGRKFKACHDGRERLPQFNHHHVAEAFRKELRRRYCSYAGEAGEPCGAEIIGAHTVQKEGGLRAISRAGKVYSLIATMGGLEKNGGRLDPRLVGIGDASVFPGFCSTHDNDLFKPIEDKDCAIGAWEALLFAYRAVSFEAFFKRAMLAVAPLFARLDEGLPVEDQELAQNMARHFHHGALAGEAGTRARKAAYDARVRARDVNGFSYAWTRFDGLLPLVCCGAFLPDNDLTGRPLQRLAHGTGPFEQVTLNITSYGGQSVIVFGWTGGPEGPAERFVRSYQNLGDDDRAAAAVRLGLEYLENSYLSPAWWDALTSVDRRRLVRHSVETHGPRSAAVSLGLRQPVPHLRLRVIDPGGSLPTSV